MAKVPAYATYLYNQCVARKEAPDSEFEGCDEILAYLVVKNAEGANVKITELVQSLMFGTGPTVHRKVTTLAERKLIEMTTSKTDGRAKDIIVTVAGLERLREQSKLVKRWLAE